MIDMLLNKENELDNVLQLILFKVTLVEKSEEVKQCLIETIESNRTLTSR